MHISTKLLMTKATSLRHQSRESSSSSLLAAKLDLLLKTSYFCLFLLILLSLSVCVSYSTLGHNIALHAFMESVSHLPSETEHSLNLLHICYRSLTISLSKVMKTVLILVFWLRSMCEWHKERMTQRRHKYFYI